MSKSLLAGVAAVLTLAAPVLLAGSVQAQEKHDSNTLHKLGKAIEYPIRKTGKNVSITAHRATGQNSVDHRRNGDRTHDTVITPKGHLYRMHHRRHHRAK